MADFTELPVDEGVGDWHFNRFRVAFEPPKGTSAVTLGNILLANFPHFIISDYARANWGDRNYDGHKTAHFHGYAKYIGADLGAPHSDWVAIVFVDPKTQGFTVQTIKREFADALEDVEAVGVGAGVGAAVGALVGGIVGGVVGLVGGPGGVVAGAGVGAALAAGVGAGGGPHVNRMHFLAGRRAWRVDNGSVFGLSGGVMVLETVAVERFSHEAYNIADAIMGLEKRLPDVWLSFLWNFVRLNGLKTVDQALKPRWKKDHHRAMYLTTSYDGVVGLNSDPEFQGVTGVAQLYPAIVPWN